MNLVVEHWAKSFRNGTATPTEVVVAAFLQSSKHAADLDRRIAYLRAELPPLAFQSLSAACRQVIEEAEPEFEGFFPGQFVQRVEDLDQASPYFISRDFLDACVAAVSGSPNQPPKPTR